uniref:Uncharacterized protein n=1 Tax=Oryza punctata TaxID=4537 RepID=A0A0E0JFP7_ORYPU
MARIRSPRRPSRRPICRSGIGQCKTMVFGDGGCGWGSSRGGIGGLLLSFRRHPGGGARTSCLAFWFTGLGTGQMTPSMTCISGAEILKGRHKILKQANQMHM